MGNKRKAIAILFIVLVLFLLSNKRVIYHIYTNLVYEPIGPEEIIELLSQNNESKEVILIGRKTCPSCIDLFSQSRKEIKEISDVNIIYYYNTDKHRDDPMFENVGGLLNLSFVPTIIIIQDGNIFEHTYY